MVKEITNALIPLLSNPRESVHLLEIARQITQPHPTVRLWLRELEKEGIVIKQHKGRMTAYKLNSKHPLILEYALIAEKQKVIKQCKSSKVLTQIVRAIHETAPDNSQIILFGSATKSIDKAADTDLLTIAYPNSNTLSLRIKHLNKEPHIINVKQLSDVSPTLKEEIIKNHLLLQAGEDVARWLLW